MKDLVIMFGVGLFVFLTGVLTLKRENRIFKTTVTTKATVVNYYDYISHGDGRERMHPMYTMAVEYKLPDGTVIHAREQKGSGDQKYQVGTEIMVAYSKDKSQLFNVKGDKSRKIAMVGMIIVGILLMLLFGSMILMEFFT